MADLAQIGLWPRKTGRARRPWRRVRTMTINLSYMTCRLSITRRGRHGAAVDGGRSFSELGAELREHRAWLERAGLTALQADALIDRLDRSGPVFDSLRSEQADLTARLGAALAAPVVSGLRIRAFACNLTVPPEAFTEDPDRLARFEREAKVLASPLAEIRRSASGASYT